MKLWAMNDNFHMFFSWFCFLYPLVIDYFNKLWQIDFRFFECDWMCPYLESIVWEFLVFPSLLHLLIIINNPSTKHCSKKQTKGKKHPVNRKQRKMVKLAYILVFIFGTADRTYGSNPDCMDYKIQVSDNYKISL